ncbi:MAG: tetratricopeptide repeat protein [Caldilineaceae bacterium]
MPPSPITTRPLPSIPKMPPPTTIGHSPQRPGELDAAIADYDQAIALNPEDATAYNNRSIARRDLPGELDAAIADYDQAIALNPQYATAYNNRGNACDQGELDAAIADYDQAIALNPQYANAFIGRGNARSDQGEPMPPSPIMTRPLPSTPKTPPPTTIAAMLTATYRNTQRRLPIMTRPLPSTPKTPPPTTIAALPPH